MKNLGDRWLITPEAIDTCREHVRAGQSEADIREMLIELGFPRRNAENLASIATHTCEYTAAHMLEEVPATTIIEVGPVGRIPACDACLRFFRDGDKA